MPATPRVLQCRMTPVTLRDIACASALSRCGVPGMDWSLNPYVGCAHGCVYCYASFMGRFTGHEEAWGTFVDARANVAEVLAREVRRGRSGRVLLASVTDAWQPVERERRLTRACLEVLAGSGLSLAALTKSDLVVRDVDVLRAFGGLLGDAEVSVGFTVTTLSDELASILEPAAPSPSRRLDALERLAAGGIRTWVFVAPILPGLTDGPEDIAALACEARRRGAAEVEADPLSFYPAAVARLGRVVARHRPRALPAWREAAADPEKWRERAMAVAKAAMREARGG